MPKHRKHHAASAALVRYAPAAPRQTTVVVRAPSPKRRALAPVLLAGGAAARHYGKRAGRRIASHVGEKKHIYIALAAAGGLGLLKRAGVPLTLGAKIPFLGAKGTAAAIAWGAAILMKNRTAKYIAVGLTAVWLYDLAAGEGTSGLEDD